MQSDTQTPRQRHRPSTSIYAAGMGAGRGGGWRGGARRGEEGRWGTGREDVGERGGEGGRGRPIGEGGSPAINAEIWTANNRPDVYGLSHGRT